MTYSIINTEEQMFTVLRAFLLEILPAGTEVIRGQVNRVPEPPGSNWVVMWPILGQRLSTNIDSYDDVAFIGHIDGTVLTVTQMLNGTIAAQQQLSGVSVASGQIIESYIAGSGTDGGVGQYNVSVSQTLASTTLQSGSKYMEQDRTKTIQIDVHGPLSGDNADLITTVFRSSESPQIFSDQCVLLNPDLEIQPLYCDDAVQVPFINAEQQYENRYIIKAALQMNNKVALSQQFADQVSVDTVSVERVYPPA